MSKNRSYLSRLLLNIYSSGLYGKVEIEVLREVILMNTIFTMGIVFLIPFGILAYFQGNFTLGIFDHAAAASLFISAFSLRKTKNHTLIKYFSLSFMYSLFVYFFFSPDINNTVYLWTFTLPLFTLFFLGAKRGSAITLSFLGIVILLFVFDFPSPRYTLDFKLRYSGTFLAIFGIAFFFEYIRIKTQKYIKEKNEELETAINKLQKVQGALQESEQKYRHLVEKANIGILILQDTLIKLANPYLIQLSGYTMAEVIDKPFAEFLLLGERQRVKEIYNRRMAGEQVPEFYETVSIRKDESRLDVEISACPITFNNKPAEIVFVRDITERKKAEKEKEQLERQLRQSQKMEAIGQLAGGIAHDFNNMLGGIMGFANLIKIRLASKENKLIKYVDNILSSANRAADLTAKLLAFARRGKFQMVVVDMNDCIFNTIKILEHSIDKRIRIIKKLKARQATVMGDPTQLQNVILNLAVNARDAMPGRGKLTFFTEIVNIQPDFKPTGNFSIDPGTYLLIEVSDTGVGIEKKHMAKLFEPFFTTKKQSKGTGLGLASVYGTVKNHNGYIDVESKVGQGATFKIYMNLVDKPHKKTSVVSDNIQLGTGHILVVDDEKDILEFGEEMLAELGYSSKTCKDVQEALDYYKNHHQQIDLVITDIIMPKLSGFEFYKEIKKINPQVKVVVTSGYSLEGKARELIEEGARGFIQKPFSLRQLSAVLYNALFENDAN